MNTEQKHEIHYHSLVTMSFSDIPGQPPSPNNKKLVDRCQHPHSEHDNNISHFT